MFNELPKDIQSKVTYLLETDNFTAAAELRDAYLYLNAVVDNGDDDFECIDTLDHPAFLNQYDPSQGLGIEQMIH